MKVRRVPFLDEYVEGGESAVLVGDRVFVLSELATTILAEVGDGVVDALDLADVLLATYGAPPDGTDIARATEAALQILAEQGLVVLSP